jgi:hypothetical protein
VNHFAVSGRITMKPWKLRGPAPEPITRGVARLPPFAVQQCRLPDARHHDLRYVDLHRHYHYAAAIADRMM